MLGRPAPWKWIVSPTKWRPALAVVAIRNRQSGEIFRGEPDETHDQVQEREGLGAPGEGLLDGGFVDLESGDFLNLGQASQRFPLIETGPGRKLVCGSAEELERLRAAEREQRQALRNRPRARRREQGGQEIPPGGAS